MIDRRTLWLLLPRQLRRLPADIAAMLVFTILVNIAVLAPIIRDTPLRIPLGLVFVLFIPGYVFIAALFPEAGENPSSDAEGKDPDVNDEAGFAASVTNRSGIDGIERTALAFGLSIAITPLIGLGLNFTPWGIQLVPIMAATTIFTVGMSAIAAYRRWQLPLDERFRVPYQDWYETGRTELLEPESRFDGILNILLVASIILAVGTVTFAIVVPPEGEQFSAVYLLTEDGDNEYVADGYPTEFVQGESQEVIVGVDNHKHQTTEYTIVVLQQEVETIPGNTSTASGEDFERTDQEEPGANASVNETVVTDQQELDRFGTELAHNESWHYEYDLEPSIVGDDIRVMWLLFPGDDVPEEPSVEDTEYSVHLWVDVDEPAEDN